MRQHQHEVDLGEFTRLGLLTVPAALIPAVAAPRVSLHAFREPTRTPVRLGQVVHGALTV